MTDIRIQQTIKPGEYNVVTLDWLKTPVHLLDETNELQTAVILALGTDRLANPDDPLPVIGSDDRRGWWGDVDAEEIWDAWPIGARIWLLERAKITDAGYKFGATVANAEAYVREALQPFLEKKIASKMSVTAVRNGLGEIDVTAVLYRGPQPDIALQFQGLWDGIKP
jgi:phage gp46-like protein